jgi:hypothetical protein
VNFDVIMADKGMITPLSAMTRRIGPLEDRGGLSSVVTGVLAAAGTFYTVTNSALLTVVITTLAVTLALVLSRRSHGTRR